MDPYDYALKQGQVAGQKPSGNPDDGDFTDLMDLLAAAFLASGQMDHVQGEGHQVLTAFAKFANNYLAERRVVSTGIVEGAFSLVFEDGVAIPLASSEPATPQKPVPVIPITIPKESKMKGMTVVDTSVPMTGFDRKTGRPK
jgi:hypothetical protein